MDIIKNQKLPMIGKIGSRPSLLLTLGGFAFLWVTVINQLRVEWSVNPQYSYGWVVPLLCLGLLIRRWQAFAENRKQKIENKNKFQLSDFNVSAFKNVRLLTAIFIFVAFLWLPTRLVQEANPEWRLISWALAIEVVVLTLLAVQLAFGSAWTRRVAFPFCFFLVAVPWPTIVEGHLIQALTRANVATTIECVGWLGIPAIQHGNVIEISTGMVGVNDACSGIRSFQSSIMICLFLGEFYRLSLFRRLLLLPMGFITAFVFNVFRTSLLVSVASKHGIAAIDSWHDPAGVTISIACTLVLWGVVVMLMKSPKPNSQLPTSNSVLPAPCAQPSTLNFLCFGLLAWLVLVEVGVESWYRWHEARLPKSVLWTVDWPHSNPTFFRLDIGEKATRMLRYDEAVSTMWQEKDGTRWQMIYIRWLPGRIAVYLATMHTPEACLTAAGGSVHPLPDLKYLPVHDLNLPFREYVLDEQGGSAYVFYCLWEDRANEQFFETQSLTYGNRLGPVMAGQRNVGQRSLEVVVRGFSNMEDAQNALVRQLEELLKVNEPGSRK
jgi:exosortase